MGKFMQQLLRGIVVAAVFLMLLGAWDSDFVLLTFRVGVAILILAFGYGLLGGKDIGLPLVVSFVLMFEAALADKIQTGIRVASVIMALAALIWLIRTRRRNHRRRPHEPRRNPTGWEGNFP